MKIWKYRLQESEGNLFGVDFDNGYVNAETFEEATEKVQEYVKASELKLVIIGINLELEVEIE